MTKFAMSFSLGKDSSLALFRMLSQSYSPVCLITMFQEDSQRSWFHGADRKILRSMENCMGIPLHVCPASGGDYAKAFEQGLEFAKKLGATQCAFGDIDLEINRAWEEERCHTVGIIPVFPLWQEDRKTILADLLRRKFSCIVKTINTSILPLEEPEKEAFARKYLGTILDWPFLDELSAMGLDECGENGEYHTLVSDGPIFKRPLPIRIGKILHFDNHASIEITAI